MNRYIKLKKIPRIAVQAEKLQNMENLAWTKLGQIESGS